VLTTLPGIVYKSIQLIKKRSSPKVEHFTFGKSQRSIFLGLRVITLSVAEVALWLLIGLSNRTKNIYMYIEKKKENRSIQKQVGLKASA